MKGYLLILFVAIHGLSYGQPMPYLMYPTTSAATGDHWNTTAGVNSSTWSYSNANLTRNSGGATGMGICIVSISGNQIWGWYNDPSNTHLESVGISTSTFTNSNYLGATSTGYGLLNGANGFYSGGSTQTLTNQPNYGAGDTVWMGMNTASQVWFAKYNSSTHHYSLSGTASVPSVGTGGFTVTSATYYIASGDQHDNIITLIIGSNVPALLISDFNTGGVTYVYTAHN